MSNITKSASLAPVSAPTLPAKPEGEQTAKALVVPTTKKELVAILDAIKMSHELAPVVLKWAAMATHFVTSGQQEAVNSAFKSQLPVWEKEGKVDASGIYMAEDTRLKFEKGTKNILRLVTLSEEVYAEAVKSNSIPAERAK